MAKQQVHRATMRVTSELEIPQYQKGKGLGIDFMADDETIGHLWISGANVYFRKPRQKKWSYWSFSAFADLLEKNRNA